MRRGDEIRRWLIHFEDHGSRKALREAEGRLEAEMRGLMDSIESGVLLLDAAGNIRMVSDRLAQSWDWKRAACSNWERSTR